MSHRKCVSLFSIFICCVLALLFIHNGKDIGNTEEKRGDSYVEDYYASYLFLPLGHVDAPLGPASIHSHRAGEEPHPGTKGKTEGCLPAQSQSRETTAWITYYNAPLGATIASEHPDGFQPGIAAAYAVRRGDRRIVAAEIPGLGIVPFGTRLWVDRHGEVVVRDTGLGMPDGRPWIDIAVPTTRGAIEAGARWARVQVLE